MDGVTLMISSPHDPARFCLGTTRGRTFGQTSTDRNKSPLRRAGKLRSSLFIANSGVDKFCIKTKISVRMAESINDPNSPIQPNFKTLTLEHHAARRAEPIASQERNGLALYAARAASVSISISSNRTS